MDVIRVFGFFTCRTANGTGLRNNGQIEPEPKMIIRPPHTATKPVVEKDVVEMQGEWVNGVLLRTESQQDTYIYFQFQTRSFNQIGNRLPTPRRAICPPKRSVVIPPGKYARK